MTVLLFCGVGDEMKDVLHGRLMHAAAVASLQCTSAGKLLTMAQPVTAEGDGKVQLQVYSKMPYAVPCMCPTSAGSSCATTDLRSNAGRVSPWALRPSSL